ncbi:hypothetical protein ABT033_37970 [Streptomyces pharetrae]|uniref:hypothetical protein n=1 Tax=Streptomyces pharetrae TaxID=291370 RepID=UPI003351E1B8
MEFFDRLKAQGWDYARISQHLGQGFSAATLSRIANGEKIPNRNGLDSIMGLVEEIAEQPLTEQVRGHVYDVYMRALAVAKPEWHHAYLLEDENRRLQAEVDRQSRLRQADGLLESSPSGDNLGPEHPLMRLRDEVLRHVQQAAHARVPLITQPSQRYEPLPGDSAADVMLHESRQALGVVRESVTRHILLLEAAEEVPTAETTPPGAVPTGEPARPGPNEGGGQRRPQRMARAVLFTAVTITAVITVLLAGMFLHQALRPDTMSARPWASPTRQVNAETITAGKSEDSVKPPTLTNPSDKAEEGATSPSALQRSARPSTHHSTPGQATNRGTNQDNGDSASPDTTASTEASPPSSWNLTIRLSADSDGEIKVTHNDGEQAPCSKTLNQPAKECKYSIPHNNMVTLEPVDYVQTWGSGVCEGADHHGGCGFIMTSNTELKLHVLREPR